MASKDPDDQSAKSLAAAFEKFRQAWFSGDRLEPGPFCEQFPECGEALRRKIEDFVFVAGGLGSGRRKEKAEPESTEKTAPGSILGDFRIVREIGRGGMGQVFEAEQQSLKRRVALKLLRPHLRFSDEAVERFQREAEAGGRQSHPGIVAVYALGEHEGTHFIAQELIEESRSLDGWLGEKKKEGSFHPGYFREVAEIIARVAEALHHAHANGVIHRDVKPSNILLTRDGFPKVTDFGLAKVADAHSITRAGSSPGGTFYYMSPEQATSKRINVDFRTDIFSLGVTLYEIITLSRPFEGKTDQEILKRIQIEEPRNPRKVNPLVPRDLAVICLKAMEKRPEERYPTMEALARDLQRFLDGDVVKAKPAGPGRKLVKQIRRNPALSGAVGLALAALVTLASVLFWSFIRDANNFKTIIRLSDGHTLSQLKADADRLWPVTPSLVSDLQNWLQQADGLVINFKEHRARLESIRAQALPYDQAMQQEDYETHPDADKLRQCKAVAAKLQTDLELLQSQNEKPVAAEGTPSDPLMRPEIRIQGYRDRLARLQDQIMVFEKEAGKRRTWRFVRDEEQWWHDVLTDLVALLDVFCDEECGLYHSVKQRLAFALTVDEVCGFQFGTAWECAIESISDQEDSPIYRGLRLEPQPGLVPIGKDPRSGLWEFAHLQTGDVPERNPEGELQYGENHGLVFVLIPGGSFSMGARRPDSDHPLGSPNVDPNCIQWEMPVHTVTVPPFLLSKYEMTQAQWLRITGEKPSRYKPGEWYGDKVLTLLHPVEHVSWDDCARWLGRLNLRFPTDSEWEYAARAGTTTVRWFGDDYEPGTVNVRDRFYKQYGEKTGLSDYEKQIDDGYARHAHVNTLLPNPFGLHHILGNVNELCADGWHSSYDGAPDDGSAWESLENAARVLRSGHFDAKFAYCRSAYRQLIDANRGAAFVGIRPALSLH